MDSKDISSFFVGVAAVISLFVAAYMSNETDILLEAQPLRILYIGAAVGHFFGLAIKDDASKLSLAYLGGFTTLMIAIGTSDYSLELLVGFLTSTLTLLLMHYSGIIEDYNAMREFFKTISEYLPVGLLFLVISEHVVPWFIENITPFQTLAGIYGLTIIAIITYVATWAAAAGIAFVKQRYESIQLDEESDDGESNL